jgi:hypothetical protein
MGLKPCVPFCQNTRQFKGNAIMDVSAIVTAIGGAVAPALAVGAAVVIAYAGVWVISLIKRVM